MDDIKKNGSHSGVSYRQLVSSHASLKRSQPSNGKETTKNSESRTETHSEKRVRLSASESTGTIQSQPEKRIISSLLPVTALGKSITKPKELTKVLQPELEGINPAVFVIETNTDGSRKSTYSSDILKKVNTSFPEASYFLKDESRLGFVFPSGSYKEVSVKSLKEKDKSGYLSSVILAMNVPIRSKRDFFLKKVLLSACLYLGWIEHPDKSLAKENLLGINEKDLDCGIQETFFLGLEIKNKELIELMIDWGADVNSVHPDDDLHPLQLARSLGLKEIEKKLLIAGADIDVKNLPHF